MFDFRVDTDVWFLFSVFFISGLSLFMIAYVVLPYFVRRAQLKRIRAKQIWKNEHFEAIEKKYDQHEVSQIIQMNRLLKTDLTKALLESIHSKENNLSTFYSEFEKVYPTFYSSLIRLFPNMTTNEIKLCCLIRMKLTSKEISRILNITPDSVNKARYRLRQKMNIDSKTDLDLYLMHLN
ncbi:helix-turn-helix transcriptional regulator [Psychroflexus montanilacus]|uniref:helix-turn-helix transcriptional regulator n=1 Tax=Psychroflexus montanilacus TaxID=2873598 RepID=UPI001CCFD4F3|nr:LuxR C-terminal-related transcriptional regulator [Psychroflexus montanilacus]MBZ9650945.1 LuxR C-terminal-related transcriptional regulator [Psychroflexus montanilacus]